LGGLTQALTLKEEDLTLNDLTVGFSHLDRMTLLEDWNWKLKGSFLPILLSASGDAFVQHVGNDEVWWLDTGGAEFSKVAETQEQFNELLTQKEFVIECFAVQMIGDLMQSGNSLGDGQIYSLKQPWILGGKYELSNIEATDIEVHFSITGQIAQQVIANES
jgi:hypothetical protein